MGPMGLMSATSIEVLVVENRAGDSPTVNDSKERTKRKLQFLFKTQSQMSQIVCLPYSDSYE